MNMQMKNGLSALMIACENEHNSVVKLLIEKGARMNMLRNDGWSALMIACYCGRGEVTQILLDHHADTNIQDTDGKTAFSCACETGHTEIVELLLSCKHIKTLPQTVHADTFSTPKSSEQEKGDCISRSIPCMHFVNSNSVVQKNTMFHNLKR